MIILKEFKIENGKVYGIFLSNELSISMVCSSEEITDKSNNEIIDYLYSKVRPTVTEWCEAAGLPEDTIIEYYPLTIDEAELTVSNFPTAQEIRRLNEENLRIMDLADTQRIKSGLLQAHAQIKEMKQLIADLASLQLEG